MTLDQLSALQADCSLPHLPTGLTYELRMAVSGVGPRAYDWSDKPHRLLYDACQRIEELEGQPRTSQLAAVSDDAIERVARALDPEIWSDNLPIPTRGDTINFHARRQKSISQAKAAISALAAKGTGDE